MAGAIFSALTGFSFIKLHFVTVFWSLLAAGSLAYGLWLLKVTPLFSTLAVVVFIFNPLFLPLSLTFMTDISFVALSSLLLICFAYLLKKPYHPCVLAATISLSILTVLDRQIGIIIPITFSTLQLLPSSRQQQLNWQAHLPLFASLCCLLGFHHWLEAQHLPLFSYRTEKAYLLQLFSQGAFKLTAHILRNIFVAILYIGLMLSPLLCLIGSRLFTKLEPARKKFIGLLFGEIVILLSLFLFSTGSLMPLADNLFNSYGIGPLFVAEAASDSLPKAPLPTFVLATATLISIAGTAILGCLAALAWLERKAPPNLPIANGNFSSQFQLFLWLFCLLYLTTICVRGFFDRYLINLLPASIWLLAVHLDSSEAGATRINHKLAILTGQLIAVAAALALSTSTVLSTSDYLEWNKAKWSLLHHCLRHCTSDALQIDGGLEFNGWYAYAPMYRDRGIIFNPSMTHGDLYIIAPGPVRGYNLVKAAAYRTFLPKANNQLLLLKKQH